ncbi:MAG: hypothetical protein H8E48_10105 [Chloroflexi bacterium]|nr:hypothetical protein [Chloroflexota bacterium]
MDSENWTGEEKRKLKAMTINPLINSRRRLREIIEYYRAPGASLWAVTDGDGPFHLSKELGRKIREYVDDGSLDWVLGETTDRPLVIFDEEWRRWLQGNAIEFSEARFAYQGELNNWIQRTETHLGLRATFKHPRVNYGPKHQPFVESVFKRDPEIAAIRRKFESALNKGEITEARELGEKIGQILFNRIVI